MGNKLKNPGDYAPYQKVKVFGVVGSCYCCNQQIHIDFKNMDLLSVAKVQGDYYFVLVCDKCEIDMEKVKDKYEKNISYDFLHLIQKDLKDKLAKIIEKKGSYTEKERDSILLRLYKEASLNKTILGV